MPEITLHPFYLASSVKALFPLTVLKSAGMLGNLFYYDFEFPFEMNTDLLAMTEERLKGELKEGKEGRVYSMVPSVAEEFLKSKKQKHLLEKGENADLFHIIELGPFYDLTQLEVSDQKMSHFIKLCHFEVFSDEDGKKITRIYGASAEDPKSLKDFTKAAASFFKAFSTKACLETRLVGLAGDKWYLRPEGILLEQKAIGSFLPLFSEMKLEVGRGLETIDPLPKNIVWFSNSSLSSFENGPAVERVLKGGHSPLFQFEVDKGSKEGPLLLKRVLEKFFSFFKEWDIPLEASLQAGRDFLAFLEPIIEENTSFKPLEIDKKNLKSKNSLRVELFALNSIGMRLRVALVEASFKEEFFSIRVKGLGQIFGLAAIMKERRG